ncbi:MAG: hypothetical protein CVT48_02290 [Thermoplasmata archaeon HGW-Thermoplasmata-1]|nr:MAG: hypothetical protein CVT48_02290 [Thermoplasmata archaeon HGW-Thermoplasmata-1]
MSGKNVIKPSACIMIAVLFAATAFSGCIGGGRGIAGSGYTGEIKTFSSYEELKEFVAKGVQKAGSGSYGIAKGIGAPSGEDMAETSAPPQAPGTEAASDNGGSPDYTGTNVQVEGVDEADSIKTDGNYIYKVMNKWACYNDRSEVIQEEIHKVSLVRANGGEMDLASEITVSNDISGIFVNGNSLVVIENDWGYYYWGIDYGYEEGAAVEGEKTDGGSGGESPPGSGGDDGDSEETPKAVAPENGNGGGYCGPKMTVSIYDISDRTAPAKLYEYTVSASYANSRMIGDWVYIMSSQWVYTYSENSSVPMPIISENGVERTVDASEVQYVDCPQPSYSYTIISAINVKTQDAGENVFMLGSSSTIYVSRSNIYITTSNNWWYWIWVDDKNVDVDRQETSIHKLSIDAKKITLAATGKVTGHVLNQFSMDEHEGYFRVATTTEREWWRGGEGNDTQNNVYVLDSKMKTVGKLEGLAKGERIYSARFMGDKAYIVTFRQVDPLFVIDLSSPTAPAVLGWLKIPGFSEYLHPYDDSHLIGVGRNATEEGWTNGVKISLFDLTDFSNPKEMSNYVIEGAWSEAGGDHHAFFFDRTRDLMVVPVEIYQWGGMWREGGNEKSNDEPERFSGAYVFNVTLAGGIKLAGKIEHGADNMPANESYEYTYKDDESYVSVKPGDYVNITLTCGFGKQWMLYDYDEYVLNLTKEDSSTAPNGTKTYRFEFRVVGEGYTYVEVALINSILTGLEKEDAFTLDVSSYMPYWFDYGYRISRSLRISDVLYTASESMLVSSDLKGWSMRTIDSLDLAPYSY